MTRKEKAYTYFIQGHNCAQSVLCAFADVIQVDERTLASISSAFGAGFGRTRGQCGTVSAMGMVVGMLVEHVEELREDKAHVYAIVQDLMRQFVERNGTVSCGDLLKNVKNLTKGYVPQVRDEEYYKARPCLKFVLDAVELLEERFQLPPLE